MKEDGHIETVFSRFQISVSGLQVLNKSYTTFDHVKKILRSLPVRYKPKVTTTQEDKDLNTLSLESLISNIQSYEMELNIYESAKKPKFISFETFCKIYKGPKIWNSEEASQSEGSKEDLDDEEMTFIIKIFQYLAKKNKRLSGRSSDFIGSSSRD